MRKNFAEHVKVQILKAEQICGYRIERLSNFGDIVSKFAAYDDDDTFIAQAESRKGERITLKMLIEKVYYWEGDKVLKSQNGLCADCAKPLLIRPNDFQRHHIVPRSKGRRDRNNLVVLCKRCHRERHRTGNL